LQQRFIFGDYGGSTHPHGFPANRSRAGADFMPKMFVFAEPSLICRQHPLLGSFCAETSAVFRTTSANGCGIGLQTRETVQGFSKILCVLGGSVVQN
jgi:hypothetical protein